MKTKKKCLPVCLQIFQYEMSIQKILIVPSLTLFLTSFVILNRLNELPQQVHLSFGESSHDIIVTWVTFQDSSFPRVAYKESQSHQIQYAEGTTKTFIDGGKKKKVQFIHVVILCNLKPDTSYVYRCRNSYEWSDEFQFRTVPAGEDWSPKLIIYGDMGVQGAATFDYIKNDIENGLSDAIIHVGDIAYNMATDNGNIGDAFLRMIEPVASRVPYMTAVGNHEEAYNFSHYRYKFSMPGNSEGLFYSFDLGPVHFVAISTEAYYFLNYGCEPLVRQYQWLVKDLKEASQIENRRIHPWIIVYGHRPFYCTSHTEDCSKKNNVLKNGFPDTNMFALEELMYYAKVDLAFWGHMHYYERSYPIYKNKKFNVTCKQVYMNPCAPVHVITGAAGMCSGTERVAGSKQDLFAFLSNDYSYTHLIVHNKTHLLLEQKSATKNGKVIDFMWLIKHTVH